MLAAIRDLWPFTLDPNEINTARTTVLFSVTALAVSLYSLWRTRERYDLRVLFLPNTANLHEQSGKYIETWNYVISNAGNKPFTVVQLRAFFEHGYREDLIEQPFGCQIGEGHALAYGVHKGRQVPLYVEAMIHTGKKFKEKLPPMPKYADIGKMMEEGIRQAELEKEPE